MNTAVYELEKFLLDLMDRRPPDKMCYTYNNRHRRSGITVTYKISWSKSISITYEFESYHFRNYDAEPTMRSTFRVSLDKFWGFSGLSYHSSEFMDTATFIRHSYRYNSILQEQEEAASIAAKDSERNRVIRFLKKGK